MAGFGVWRFFGQKNGRHHNGPRRISYPGRYITLAGSGCWATQIWALEWNTSIFPGRHMAAFKPGLPSGLSGRTLMIRLLYTGRWTLLLATWGPGSDYATGVSLRLRPREVSVSLPSG